MKLGDQKKTHNIIDSYYSNAILLSEPWRIIFRAMTDYFQRHEGHISEPWWTALRALRAYYLFNTVKRSDVQYTTGECSDRILPASFSSMDPLSQSICKDGNSMKCSVIWCGVVGKYFETYRHFFINFSISWGILQSNYYNLIYRSL